MYSVVYVQNIYQQKYKNIYVQKYKKNIYVRKYSHWCHSPCADRGIRSHSCRHSGVTENIVHDDDLISSIWKS